MAAHTHIASQGGGRPEHDIHHDLHDVTGDKKAAFVGLVGGMALIGVLVYGMVLWTNAQFAGHGAAGAAKAGGAAAQTAH